MNNTGIDTAHEQAGHTASQLALHKDPSLRRDKSLAQNQPTARTRSTRYGIEWVPASELGHRAGARVLRAGADRGMRTRATIEASIRKAGRRLADVSSFGRRSHQHPDHAVRL